MHQSLLTDWRYVHCIRVKDLKKWSGQHQHAWVLMEDFRLEGWKLLLWWVVGDSYRDT